MIDEVVSIKARDGTAIGLRIYRPGGEARVPSLFGASPYRFDISLEPQAYLFKVGHRTSGWGSSTATRPRRKRCGRIPTGPTKSARIRSIAPQSAPRARSCPFMSPDSYEAFA
jgi:hypothetical protein